MSEEQTRAGVVAVIGAPNAGKSTLVNALVGQKVAIVSPKAQTTRARLMGIAVAEKTQILLVDTPGIFEPKRRLDRAMVAAAWSGAQDADLILLVIDADARLGREVEKIIASLGERQHPLFLALNKIDLVKKPALLALASDLMARLNPDQLFMISAANGDGVADVKAAPELLARATRARYVLADKAYDADALRRSLRQAGAVPVIPGRRNRKRAIRYDKQRYRDRHLIENAFCRLKDFRRVATRYDKLAANFLSGVALATAVAFWL